MSEASHFITKYNLATDETISTSVTNCLANIHSYILRDCKQTVWAGDQAAEVQMVQVSINERKKEQIKYKQLKVPNLPYSKMILLEQIRNRHKKMDEPARNNVFAGPMTFRRFLHSFRHTYSEMSEKRATNLSTYKKVLSALDTTRSDCEKMKDEHKDVMVKYYNVVDETSTILKKLTHKATTLEKLKAKIGQATALSAFLQMNDLSSDEEDDDSLLAPEERDKYDVAFEKMREQKMRSRQVKAIEELATAKKKVEECRIKLGYAKEQVVIWKGKVDRQCIERVRSFTNPSLLVVQVMEMVMVLIGKRMSFGRDNQNKSTHVSDETSGRISASSSSTRFTKKTVASKRELPDKFDRQQWKIMQLAMTDSIKFVDMLHNVPWEDGLPNDTRDAVEGYLAKNKDGAYGITGEGSLLDNAADTKFQAVRRTPSPDNTRGITIAAAKFSSEDAAVLVQYTIAIVEYTRLCVPLKAALEKQHKLEREIEENERIAKEKANKAEEPEDREATPEPEPELDEEDLPRIEAELKVLQDEYDKSVVEKHKLSTELKSMHERMKAANDVLNSLTNQELQWRAYVENNKSESLLYSHCIVASAYLVYAGAFNIDTRKRLGEFFVNICQHHGLPLPEEVLFRKLQLFDYLYTKLEKQKLELLRLPMTPLMLENAAIIMQEDNYRAWPLICDPTSRSVQWVKCYIPHSHRRQVSRAEKSPGHLFVRRHPPPRHRLRYSSLAV
ncbi:hypothetical protein EB796_015243 [Bugula neritina]|uniref:Uncharacterized protein n=1 Tax=Bugula neritina TaxID=10212 RepID=A0A7J7JJE0_BUGNE|nr:hypothetical protein EB796_015243 [Bugula neritina]